MARVVGFKIWWANGTVSKIRTDGRNRAQVQQDIDALPATGLQVVMLYYDQFSVDGKTRYRRILQGNDFFYITFDTVSPPALRDWIFGQTNNLADITNNWPAAKTITGLQISDLAYKTYVDQAMADMNVTELGLVPVPNTDDR